MTETQSHPFNGQEVLKNLKDTSDPKVVEDFIKAENEHPKPRKGLIDAAEKRLAKIKADAEKAERDAADDRSTDELVAAIVAEKAKDEPDADQIAKDEARLAELDAEVLDDYGFDVDALAEQWATPSTDGGWGEDEHNLYDSLDPDVQGALKRELERRASKA